MSLDVFLTLITFGSLACAIFFAFGILIYEIFIKDHLK